MQVLQWIFQLLVVCGCWRPPSWTSPLKKFLYTVYTVLLCVLVSAITFLQLMDLLLNVENQAEFSDNIYVFLSMITACYKMYCILLSRKNIAVLTNILEDDTFRPKNQEEIEIRRKFDKKAEQQAVYYTLLVETSTMLFICVDMWSFDNKKFLYRIWLPSKHILPSVHVFIYFQQSFSFIIASIIHVACDTLIWGLLIHSCSQLEILESRLKAIQRDDDQSAKSSVCYHNRVFRYTRMINQEFRMVIFVQFTVSTLVVCFNLYVLATSTNMNNKLLTIAIYQCCMLGQIYFYCWYGNEVKLKSVHLSDVIFGIDWIQFSRDTKRILSLIMRRATMSIEFTSGHIVTMNLESFVTLLKTSYSAYNMLQNGHEA